eukprot:scaffold39593_cov176-Amphora_coffeaeformis.AAC.7
MSRCTSASQTAPDTANSTPAAPETSCSIGGRDDWVSVASSIHLKSSSGPGTSLQKRTLTPDLIIPHSFAIVIPVNKLSPVAMMHCTSPTSKWRIVSGVSSRKTFLKLMTPTRDRPVSSSSRVIRLRSVFGPILFLASEIWYVPDLALSRMEDPKSEGRLSGVQSRWTFSPLPLT